MLWRLPFCQFNRHRPEPSKVLWNGMRYIGQCRDCGSPVRKSGRGYWKRLNEQVEA